MTTAAYTDKVSRHGGYDGRKDGGMKKNFFYTVIRLTVTEFETIVSDERHFADVGSARAFARQTPSDLKAIIFRLSRDRVMLI